VTNNKMNNYSVHTRSGHELGLGIHVTPFPYGTVSLNGSKGLEACKVGE
jgi:hypothetical protein